MFFLLYLFIYLFSAKIDRAAQKWPLCSFLTFSGSSITLRVQFGSRICARPKLNARINFGIIFLTNNQAVFRRTRPTTNLIIVEERKFVNHFDSMINLDSQVLTHHNLRISSLVYILTRWSEVGILNSFRARHLVLLNRASP